MIVLGDQNYAACEVLPAMEQLCGDHEFAAQPRSSACKEFSLRIGVTNQVAKSAVLFREFWERMPKIPGPSHVTFNPDARGMIPNALALSVTEVPERLKTALL